jgi:hypothetical protein
MLDNVYTPTSPGCRRAPTSCSATRARPCTTQSRSTGRGRRPTPTARTSCRRARRRRSRSTSRVSTATAARCTAPARGEGCTRRSSSVNVAYTGDPGTEPQPVVAAASGVTRRVPEQHDTIQAAVDAEPRRPRADRSRRLPGGGQGRHAVAGAARADRNEVIIDGEFERANAVSVTADGVAVENLPCGRCSFCLPLFLTPRTVGIGYPEDVERAHLPVFAALGRSRSIRARACATCLLSAALSCTR